MLEQMKTNIDNADIDITDIPGIIDRVYDENDLEEFSLRQGNNTIWIPCTSREKKAEKAPGNLRFQCCQALTNLTFRCLFRSILLYANRPEWRLAFIQCSALFLRNPSLSGRA